MVDCGRADAGPALAVAAAATRSLLVLRPCYLALRRAVAAPVRPSGIVLIEEPERSLRRRDIVDALGVPLVAVVDCEPAVHRAVDAGLLASRLPRPLERALRSALTEAAAA
ncbi:MAG: ATPase involved in chromosome partitioning [Acidimicrobiales bacterium]|nr:ATPase involved in chromosome partitioning [Acidimicrobiales bacterium]